MQNNFWGCNLFRKFLNFLGALFNVLILGMITLSLITFLLFSYYSSDLPTAEEIENYQPVTLSRVYDKDGNVLGIFGQKNRIYTPIEDIPVLVQNAFISAEDKNFYQHLGYDPISLVKAVIDALRGKKLRGASTITQQVMKNFLLSGERTGKRKIKEIILASRIEKVLRKNQILNVYLNEIYLGQGAYGVTAASITYFDKQLDQLTIAEASFLAALPKAPSFYHPIRQKERSMERRNFVIRELNENGFISDLEAQKSKNTDLRTTLGIPNLKRELSLRKKSSYFTDEIKKAILRKYNKDILETNGLTIRSTFDETLQKIARTVLQNELITFDQSLGIYRGPLSRVNKGKVNSIEQGRDALARVKFVTPADNWFIALVRKTSPATVKIEIMREKDKFEMANLHFNKIGWVKERQLANNELVPVNNGNDLLSVGDIVVVSWNSDKSLDHGYWSLVQVPEVQGAFMAMEPNSGKVLALQGGFSYVVSPFNRALQAKRQPGSLFKPFVYLTALQNGFHPNTLVVDAPISFNQVNGVWRPENASDDWFGVAPLRKGLEYSRNLMTVRLAKAVGMVEVKKYAELFGLYENMPIFLSYSLGAGETSLFKLVTAYSVLANGGLEVEPSFFDLVQDRFGNTIYQHGNLRCLGCKDEKFSSSRKPIFLNMAKRLVDPVSVYQINSMLQGVVERGTASETVGKIGQSIAGKTGTTNDAKDVWFIGFTPSIVAGCYIGYDVPRSLGKRASGGAICGNAFKSFIEKAYGKNLVVNWKIPKDVKIVKVDYDTGEVIEQSEEIGINEFFRQQQNIKDLSDRKAIDGGLTMGQDLLLLKKQLKNYKVNDFYLKKSLGDIKTGEQY